MLELEPWCVACITASYPVNEIVEIYMAMEEYLLWLYFLPTTDLFSSSSSPAA